MPKVQYGVSTTLDGLFTGIPSLVKQVGRGILSSSLLNVFFVRKGFDLIKEIILPQLY